MKLKELSPTFLKLVNDRQFSDVDSIAGADGVMFLCPKCFVENGGARGTHAIICWSPSVAQEIEPKPGRWTMQGTGFDDLTLVAGSSSVRLTSGCRAHFHVKNGQIEDC